MLVGAFAAQAFGVTRATFDVDIVVQLNSEQISALAEHFAPPRYYADVEMMNNSVQRGTMFNVIDTSGGVKADLIPLSPDPASQAAFARRVRQLVASDEGQAWEMWCAHPTDIIIGKLSAWTEGRSAKHADDIYALLGFAFSGLSSIPIDEGAVTDAATRLGDETLQMWKGVLARAQRDTRNFDTK